MTSPRNFQIGQRSDLESEDFVNYDSGVYESKFCSKNHSNVTYLSVNASGALTVSNVT